MVRMAPLIDRRTDITRFSALVALGDVALIALFVGIGEVSHGTPPWAFPVRALEAFVPFFVGWAITSFVGGLYTADAWKYPLRAISWTAPAWITAVVLAMVIRSMPFVRGGVQPTFVFVSIGVGLAFLVPWRSAVAVIDGQR